MPRPIPEHKLPDALSSTQIQELYIDIQAKLGILIAHAAIQPAILLRNASMIMLRAKRDMIGVVGEIRADD